MKDDLIRFERGRHSLRARVRSDKIRRNSAITLRTRAEKGARLIFRSTWRASRVVKVTTLGNALQNLTNGKFGRRSGVQGIASSSSSGETRREAGIIRDIRVPISPRIPVNEIILLYVF